MTELLYFRRLFTALIFFFLIENRKAQEIQYKMRLWQLPQCHLILNLDLYSLRLARWTLQETQNQQNQTWL